jgi:hypothetical protein
LNPNADGTINAFAFQGSTLYVGGQFSIIGGQNRDRLAAISTTTGLASSWNPNASAQVNAVAVAGNGSIYAGGDFATILNTPHSRFAGFFASPDGTDVPAVAPLARDLAVAPNPFRGAVAIRFAMLTHGPAELDVFDLGGRLVRRLRPGELAAGEQRVAWDGRDQSGRDVAPGLYLVRASGSAVAATGRVLKLR